jgi:beta-glucosidase
MNYKLLITILLICLISGACTGINPVNVPTGPSESNTPQITQETSLAAPTSYSDEYVKSRVSDLLNQMTLYEKIGQMAQVDIYHISSGDIAKYFIGSILSGGQGNSASDWASLTFSLQEEAMSTRLAIPLIFGADAIHGHGNILYGATIFPHEIGLGATRDEDLVYQIGQATAEEILATGFQWNFGPIIAVPQDIRWGRTYESFSEDPVLVSLLGSSYLQGLQSLPDGYTPAQGQEIYTLATPKHFLGDGGTTFGSTTHDTFLLGGTPFGTSPFLLDRGDMRYDEEAVRELFLPPYKAAVENGAMSIMISYSSWNGVQMHASKYWITDVLKGELGFKGFVISDWGGIDQVNKDSYYQSVVTSINAGIDMDMVPFNYQLFTRVMERAIWKGDISMERINDAVSRILTVKVKLGLFDHPFSDPSLFATVGSGDHRALARQAVRESLVLLKNENDALPISKDTPLFYVAGVAADDIGIQCGGWTVEWQGNPGDIQPGTTILQGIKDAISPNSKVVFSAPGNFSGVADVGIAIVGEKPYNEGDGDRATLSLSTLDTQLVRNLRQHSRKTIVIIISGRPLVITDVYQQADAWVAVWLPGTEGNGVTDVLFGDYPFTGRLPYTWPRTNEQLPININNIELTSGCDSPLFPFGYGLGEAGSKPIEWIECPG